MNGFYNGWSGGRGVGGPPQPVIAEGVLIFENYHATEGGDSGIDSSDNEVMRMNRINLEDMDDESDSSSSSSSSSDSPDESEVRKPMLKAPRRSSNRTDSRNNSIRKLDDDRQSPPLLEVELTASDDDDDASVLELVIPIPKKYQKGPPRGSWEYTKSLMCFCCLNCK